MKYIIEGSHDGVLPYYRDLVVGKVFVEDVQVGTRKRTVNPEKVKALAESMNAIGLQQPIAVWVGDPDKILLVSGATRLAAARLLDWEEIPAIEVEMDELDRELWEIDENLIRVELTPTEEADHLARRKELWEMRAEVSGQVSPKPQGGRPEGFAADTAKKTSQPKRSINRKVRRSKKVAPEVKAEIQGTALDTGTNLDALAKMNPEEQKAAVAEAKASGKPLGPRLVPDTDDETGVAQIAGEAVRKSAPPANYGRNRRREACAKMAPDDHLLRLPDGTTKRLGDLTDEDRKQLGTEDANALTMDPDFVQAAQDLPDALREPVDSSAGCTTKKAQKAVEDFGVNVVRVASTCKAMAQVGIPAGIPKNDAKNLRDELNGAITEIHKLIRALKERT